MAPKGLACLSMLVVLAGGGAAAAFAHERDPQQYEAKTLTVRGLVDNAVTLDLEALRGLPATTLDDVPMRCAADRVKGEPSAYRGVLLRDLLAHAAIDIEEHHSRNRTYVALAATDNYAVVYSWHELFNSEVGDGVLVIYEQDGAPLPPQEGRFAAISANDRFTCARHVKWLTDIEVLRHEPAQPWQAGQ